jgi:signal transduction histidine kinase
MLRTAALLARVAGFVIVGLLTFLSPPSVSFGLPVQVGGYALIGVGLVPWMLLELRPDVAKRVDPHVLPVVLGVIAAAAAFAAAAGGGGTSLIAFAAVALRTAGGEMSLSTALTIGAGALLATETGGIVFSQGVGTLVGFPLLLLVGLLVGRGSGAYRIQAEQSALLLTQYEQLRAEQRRADVLDERARIAREIHDVLAHSLGALGIQIQAARALLTDQHDVERSLEVLAVAQRMASDGLIETRRAVHALRTDTLPLHEELARASAEHGERYLVPTHFDNAGMPRPLPPEVTVALLRTAQEALVNAAKHAPGQSIEIQLDYGGQNLRLTVANKLTDAGGVRARTNLPATSTVDGGYGLTGMRERLRLLRGTLDAGVHEDRWIVTADLPLAPRPTPESAA